MSASNKLTAPQNMMSDEDHTGPLALDGGHVGLIFYPNFETPEYAKGSQQLVRDNQAVVDFLDTKTVGPFYMYYGAQPADRTYKKFYESSIQVVLLDSRDQKEFENVFSKRGWKLDQEAHLVNLGALAVRAQGGFVHENPALENLMRGLRDSGQTETPDLAKVAAVVEQVWSAPKTPSGPSQKPTSLSAKL
jgi:hypothetical protein